MRAALPTEQHVASPRRVIVKAPGPRGRDGVVETRAGNLDQPDETLTFDHGRVDWVVLGDQTVGRTIQSRVALVHAHPPARGWRWCQTRHLGVIVSGTMHIATDGGEEFELGPNNVIDVAPAMTRG